MDAIWLEGRPSEIQILMTVGEPGKGRIHWCAPGSLGWLWDCGFGGDPQNSRIWSLYSSRILRIHRAP